VSTRHRNDDDATNQKGEKRAEKTGKQTRKRANRPENGQTDQKTGKRPENGQTGQKTGKQARTRAKEGQKGQAKAKTSKWLLDWMATLPPPTEIFVENFRKERQHLLSKERERNKRKSWMGKRKNWLRRARKKKLLVGKKKLASWSEKNFRVLSGENLKLAS
jgi:hypothetical protein